MNKELVNKMAGYLDNGPEGYFGMKQYCSCVIGHVERALGVKTTPEWADGGKVFGIYGTDASFCFGAQWTDCPKAAAVRMRYVAQHDAAPSVDQWDRFMHVQAPAVAEVEEPEYKAEHEEACA